MSRRRGKPKGPPTKELKIRLRLETYSRVNDFANSKRLPSLNQAITHILDEYLVPQIATPAK